MYTHAPAHAHTHTHTHTHIHIHTHTHLDTILCLLGCVQLQSLEDVSLACVNEVFILSKQGDGLCMAAIRALVRNAR